MSRKSGNIFRTTVSVPLTLKERMDRFAGQFNWSAVACAAFEKKVAEAEGGGTVARLDEHLCDVGHLTLREVLNLFRDSK